MNTSKRNGNLKNWYLDVLFQIQLLDFNVFSLSKSKNQHSGICKQFAKQFRSLKRVFLVSVQTLDFHIVTSILMYLCSTPT